MKRLLALLCTLAMLGGCAQNGPAPGPEKASHPAPAQTESAPAPMRDAIVDLETLNQIAREQFPDVEETWFFSDQLQYEATETFECYRTGLHLWNSVVLVRDKQNGKWQGVHFFGEDYGLQRILSVGGDGRGVLFYLDGYEMPGDHAFQDFRRTLRYDLDTEKLEESAYDNRYPQDGDYGFLHNPESLRFVPGMLDADGAELAFALTGEPVENGYPFPQISLVRMGGESNRCLLKFHRTENNWTGQQLAKLKSMNGVTDVRAEFFDNSAFTGTVLSVETDAAHTLEYAFLRQRETDVPRFSIKTAEVNDE